MLKKFSVTNFKNFQDKVTINFESDNKYTYAQQNIKNNIINHGIFVGENASGKTNLFLAIMKIHTLINSEANVSRTFTWNSCLNNENREIIYEYLFTIDGIDIEYNFTMEDESITKEFLKIDNDSIIENNGVTKKINLDNSGQIEDSLKNSDPKIAMLRFLLNNYPFEQTDIIKKFENFIYGMLFFRSASDNGNEFIGSKWDSNWIPEKIIKHQKVKDLEIFLKDHGIDYNLDYQDAGENSIIFVKFDNRKENIYKVASSGTKVLILYFTWLKINLEKTTFICIDEIDCHWHFKLSEKIIKDIQRLNVQTFVTTHNTSLIKSNIGAPNSYFLIENNIVKNFNENSYKELRQGHNLEKIYRAGGFSNDKK